MKKSACQIVKEAKEQNLTKAEFKEKLKTEGVVVPQDIIKIGFHLYSTIIKMKVSGKGKFIISNLFTDKDDYCNPAELIMNDGKHMETFLSEIDAKIWMAENYKDLKEFEDFVILFIPYKVVK